PCLLPQRQGGAPAHPGPVTSVTNFGHRWRSLTERLKNTWRVGSPLGFRMDLVRRTHTRSGVTAIDSSIDHANGPAFDLLEDPADVLAKNANADQLSTPQEQQDEHQ